MMRAERVRGALILAAAFLLAATVGLAMSMSFDGDHRASRDALAPADIAAGLPALSPPTMRVKGLGSLHQRPPVVKRRHHKARRHARRAAPRRVVRAVVATAPAPAPAAVVTPKPAPAPAAAPGPVAAPKPKPKPQAPVVFDDSA
jgi:hypothetical protein